MDATPRPQVDAGHYEFARYVTPYRWASYWHQINEVLSLEPSSVLEIGSGAGIFRTLMRHFGIPIHTIDIDPALEPECVASVLALPFAERTFDAVVCFQVLEHLPYTCFVPALREIRRVARETAILSLPDAGYYLGVHVVLPKLGRRRFGLGLPRLFGRRHVFDGEHHWEIGRRGYSLQRIKADLRLAGLSIQSEHRLWEHPFHRFFVCDTWPLD